MVRNLISELVASLRTKVPDIEAIALGGSLGRGESDNYSDVDLFVIISEKIEACAGESVRGVVESTISIAASSPSTFFPGFGLRESFVDQNGLVIEIFINSRETLDFDPIRGGMRVLFDKSGWFTHYNTSLAEAADHKIRYERIAFEYLNSLSKCVKYIARGNVLQAQGRLLTLSQVAISLGESLKAPPGTRLHGLDRKTASELEAIDQSIAELLPTEYTTQAISRKSIARSRFILELLRSAPMNPSKSERIFGAAESLNQALERIVGDVIA